MILLYILGGIVLNPKENMIIDLKQNTFITSSVSWIEYKAGKYKVRFSNGKVYFYGFNRILWLQHPECIDVDQVAISVYGKEGLEIKEAYKFTHHHREFFHIRYKNGHSENYFGKHINIEKSCLANPISKKVFRYLYSLSSLVNLKDDGGNSLLSKQYDNINHFIGENNALASYLNPKNYASKATLRKHPPIFPFGCNSSQFKAVKSAIENKISIIQGPPGTGKTQTILNIIANLLLDGKTIQVVSNNNSATANIFEKLSSPEYGLGFLVASLGNSENKSKFIENQSGKYPDFSTWKLSDPEKKSFIQKIDSLSAELTDIFTKQERLAIAKQELHSILIESEHFERYISETNVENTDIKLRKKLSSRRIMSLWQKLQEGSDKNLTPGFFFKIKSRILYGISDWHFYKTPIAKIITVFQLLYYKTRISELESEITTIEKELNQKDAEKTAADFKNLSMIYLKNKLFEKYGTRTARVIFSDTDLRTNPVSFQTEYPIILSTTFSSRSSLSPEALFDYLIMDEASQVDITTGALAVSSAQNAVIVGDAKQLPNVVTEDIAKASDDIFEKFNLSESYRFSKKSFLTSVSELFPNVPQTLLREHYRCHPQIINFCNQKFYGGNLIIMTNDNGEKNVLSVTKTVQGSHKRKHMNQRQIDSLIREVLPNVTASPEKIGIIAPYNEQVNAIKDSLGQTEIDVATVHKFQGREKDAILLTTVDDKVTEFSDNPYLLNVAVSRAKKQLHLIISGNEQPKDSNISDLVSYIEYHNFTITESKIYSVFDYLYSQYTSSRIEFLKNSKRISEYDSENLMYKLITDTISSLDLSFLGVVCHHPLNMLIRDPILLNDEECKYAMNIATHIDFLIYNRISKKPVLAIEVDGFSFHAKGSKHAERDEMKIRILDLYEIPYLRFATNGSDEKRILSEKLYELCAD